MANGEESKTEFVTVRFPDTYSEHRRKLVRSSGYLSPDFTRACMSKSEPVFKEDPSHIDELISDWVRRFPDNGEEPDRKDFRTTRDDKSYWVDLAGSLKCEIVAYIFASNLLFGDFFASNGHLVPIELQKLKNRQLSRCMSRGKKLRQTCMSGCKNNLRKIAKSNGK